MRLLLTISRCRGHGYGCFREKRGCRHWSSRQLGWIAGAKRPARTMDSAPLSGRSYGSKVFGSRSAVRAHVHRATAVFHRQPKSCHSDIRYSLENQASAIEKYAETHGFSVIQTYSDAARSGVVFRRREGLQQLIQDVVKRAVVYKAILVYDVSRWGRFQDCDEAAYYEFLCKSAGIPVHYCAETSQTIMPCQAYFLRR